MATGVADDYIGLGNARGRVVEDINDVADHAAIAKVRAVRSSRILIEVVCPNVFKTVPEEPAEAKRKAACSCKQIYQTWLRLETDQCALLTGVENDLVKSGQKGIMSFIWRPLI